MPPTVTSHFIRNTAVMTTKVILKLKVVGVKMIISTNTTITKTPDTMAVMLRLRDDIATCSHRLIVTPFSCILRLWTCRGICVCMCEVFS